MKYVSIKGTVARFPVDVTISIETDEILKAIPKVMKQVAKHLPEIIKTAQEVKDQMEVLDNQK